MGCNKSLPAEPVYELHPIKVKDQNASKKVVVRRETLIHKEQGDLKDFFEVLSIIGSTHNGILLSCRDLRSGTIRTINEISKSSEIDYSEVAKELTILNNLDHPNILKCYQTLESSRSIYIVFESTDGGPLQNRIKTSCNEVLVGNYMRDVFSAINYMHVNGVIHCNLHIGNLLLSDNSAEAQPKIVGFSHSQMKADREPIDLTCLNFEHISPDFLDEDYDEKTDIWSLGIIVYQLLVQKLPFASKKKKEILESIYKGDLDFDNPTFLNLSHNAQDFVKKLLKRDKNERMSAMDALTHPYLHQSSQEVALTNEIVQKMRRFKMKTNIVRAVLNYMNFKLDFKEHNIITLFKKMDVNFDGNISKEEMLDSFKQIGVDAEYEVDSIMENLDMDGSGSLDFSELKVVLIDWNKELKKKVLGKVFVAEGDSISFENFKHELSEILPSEWTDFCKKVKVENGKVPLGKLKEYVRANLAY